MILNRYEIFLKTAEIGNITKTAEILHYTQAGISHAIAALEKETGFSLLARSASGVTLTENGKRLLPYIQTLVNDQHGLSQAIYDINETVAGTLRIATFTSVSTQWLPTIIRKFQADYPLVEFDLLAGDYDEITERILSGRVDCGFLTAPVADPLVFHLLYKDPMNVLLPERHPLTRQDVLTLPHEEVDSRGKHVSVENTGDYDCFVRVRAFAPSDITLSYQPEDSGWTDGGDGFWYYDQILPAGETTATKLNVSYTFPATDSEDAPAEFNVIVVEECTPVLYKADGTAYADWNNVITADTAE